MTNPSPKVALVAAEKFPYGSCLPDLRRLLKVLPNGTTLLIRGTTPEMAIAILAKKTRRFSFVPYPGGRREVNYQRDVQLVRDADRVVALFEEHSVGQGGTGHVVEKALDQRKPVTSYTCSEGRLVFIGSST